MKEDLLFGYNNGWATPLNARIHVIITSPHNMMVWGLACELDPCVKPNRYYAVGWA